MEKNGKRINWMLLAAFLFSTSMVSAQTSPERSHHDPEKRLERLTTDLDLSPEQQEAIRAIDESFMAEQEAVKAKLETAHAEMRALKDAKHHAISEVLTEEQQKKLDEIHANRKERFKGKKGGKGPHGPHPKAKE